MALVVGLLAIVSTGVLAQSPPAKDESPPPPPAAAPSSGESMEPPMVGDHWTYDVRDEITGELKNTVTVTITDLTPTEITARLQNQGSAGAGVVIFDRTWNVKNSPLWRFSPNDGTGIKMPLAVGTTWQIRNNQIRTDSGATFKSVGTSKVVGSETVTTEAGTFEALKIETSINGHNSNDQTKRFEFRDVSWYVPSLDHWVKRTEKAAFNGRVDRNVSLELVDYGRR